CVSLPRTRVSGARCCIASASANSWPAPWRRSLGGPTFHQRQRGANSATYFRRLHRQGSVGGTQKSFKTVSSPLGVKAALQLVWLTLGEMRRTLASPSSTFWPLCIPCVFVPSQTSTVGVDWKTEIGSVGTYPPLSAVGP